MKISAIANRGTGRFHRSLLFGAGVQSETTARMVRKEIFPRQITALLMLKSLSYFEEAEQDPMPHMLMSVSWEEVKHFFCKEGSAHLI